MSPAALEGLSPPLAPLAHGQVWLVGGGVRDALLGRPVHDVDLAIRGDATAAAARLARHHRAARFPLSREFGAWRVSGGSLPFQVDITPLQGETLADDLSRRDLTINALALPVGAGAERLVDNHGGRRDLAARRLRAVGPRSMAADPVRVLRAARLAEQLDCTPEAALIDQTRAASAALWTSPGERLMDELGRIVRLDRADRAIRMLDIMGGLGALVPQLEQSRGVDQSPYHQHDVLGHVLEVVEHAVAVAADPEPVFRTQAPRVAEVLARPLGDGLSAREGLILAALTHDMAKPATRAVTAEGRVTFIGHDRLGAEMADRLMGDLRTSRRLREMVVRLVRWHLPLGFLVHRTPLSLRQIDRYLRQTAPSEAEVIVLTVADRLATNGPRTTASAIGRHLVLAREVMEQHFAIADRGPIRPPIPPDHLAAQLGVAPGPWLGRLIEALREEQLVGSVISAQQTLSFARKWCELNSTD